MKDEIFCHWHTNCTWRVATYPYVLSSEPLFAVAAPPHSSPTETTMYTPTILALRGEPISVASMSLIYIPNAVTNFVLTLIGAFATCFRLWRRKTTTYIWWDDIWAALTMILGITFMTSFELFLQNQSKNFYFLTARGRRHIYVHTNLICSFSFSHSWN